MNTETKERTSRGRIPGGMYGEPIECEVLAETHDGKWVCEYLGKLPGSWYTVLEPKSEVTPDNPESLRETLDDETWLYLRDTKEIPRALLVLIAHARTDDWAREHLRGIRHMINLELEGK